MESGLGWIKMHLIMTMYLFQLFASAIRSGSHASSVAKERFCDHTSIVGGVNISVDWIGRTIFVNKVNKHRNTSTPSRQLRMFSNRRKRLGGGVDTDHQGDQQFSGCCDGSSTVASEDLHGTVPLAGCGLRLISGPLLQEQQLEN